MADFKAEKEALLARLAEIENRESDNVVEFPKLADAPAVDAEFTEAEAEEATQEGEKIVTMVHLGYTEHGNLIFQVEGEGNLLAVEGLLKYAEREMAKVWEARAAKLAADAAALRRQLKVDKKVKVVKLVEDDGFDLDLGKVRETAKPGELSEKAAPSSSKEGSSEDDKED